MEDLSFLKVRRVHGESLKQQASKWRDILSIEKVCGSSEMRFVDCVRGTTTLTDGAWGTELRILGGAPDACYDEWNLTKSALVRQVAESYVQAGSRVILTNSFRANQISLSIYGLQDQVQAINRAAVKISRQAAGNAALVIASMGPTGRMLGASKVSTQQLKVAFSQQARALAAEGPDAIVIETMTDLTEARIAAAAALETRLPVIVCMVLDSGEYCDRKISGTTPEQAATGLTSEGVDGIGANCGFGIHDFKTLCQRLAAATSLPIWIKPNAGFPELIGGTVKYRTTPSEFATASQELADSGATFLGGCCGTTPEFIRAIAQQPAFRKADGRARSER
jgi:5-methyltetrahydrofolate--homocysteine methyltransferase